MLKSIYRRLAITNLKKNRRSYIPYICTSIITIMLFFDMYMLMDNSGLAEMPGASSMISILASGSVIIAIFACVFLFYTNSFLIKQRKKEIGLYNVLGMGKKELALMMFWESFITGGISILAGLLAGGIFGKLMFLILYKIIGYSTSIQYEVSLSSIGTVIILFGSIFFVSFIFNLLQIQKANPVDLLHGTATGEKEPRTKIFLTLFGVITVGTGYVLANIVDNPIDALGVFFIAVFLVILGTYALFLAGSIAFLKILRRNKSFYYKPQHFHSVSGMIYRMKQNAVGLANICILSTMVLVTLSTTVSLNMGMENILSTRFPEEFVLTLHEANDETIRTVDTVVAEEMNRHNLRQENSYRFECLSLVAEKKNDKFQFLDFTAAYSPDNIMIRFSPVSYYNEMKGTEVRLEDNEAIIYSVSKKSYGKEYFIFEDTKFKVEEETEELPMEKKEEFPYMESFTLFVKDQSVIDKVISSLPDAENAIIEYSYGADLDGKEKDKESAANAITERMQKDYNLFGYVELRGVYEEDFHVLYGSFLFLGIFLGGLFLMATVLIIYYKQISEGFEDRNRYQIMKKVGMSRKEIKKTINSQIRMVFFLPLGMAVLHVAAAFRLIQRMLRAFNLTNTNLFIACTLGTILIFGLIYGFVFKMTAKEYYRIVTK